MHGYNFERFANANELQNTAQHVVRQGESLYSIAKMHNVTVEDLMSINKLSSTMIYPNQILFIPTGNINGNNHNNYKEYITKTGDTLESILNENNISQSNFDKYNDVYKLELAPNQVIELDKAGTQKVYEVKAGDNYNSILNKNNITPMMLLDYNKEKWLAPGTRIIIG